MDESADRSELQAEVEQARADLAGSVAALLEQGQPKVVARRTLAGARHWVEVTLGRAPGADGQSRLHPERLGPIAGALVLLVLVRRRRRRL